MPFLTRLLAALGVAAVSLGAAASTIAEAAPSTTGQAARNIAVCPAPQNTLTARCHAILHVRATGDGAQPAASSGPSGYGPADLQAAYGLAAAAGANGAGSTVALVDAYDDPNAAGDLGVYRTQYGLPSMSTCTVSSTSVTSPDGRPCFAKVNQSGVAGSYPQVNGGWAQEESLDIDMVSAACPNCNILLVEASSSSFTNLGAGVNTAANLHAVAISNSYGSSGDASDASYGSYYNHPGIAITASTGDNGYGVGYPATSDYVVAVGGTSLAKNASTGAFTESAWSGAGSGCSTYQSEPTWQPAAVTNACGGRRGIADVSSDADPNTGVAVYDSYSYQGYVGWMVFGGTSASSPLIASVYALAGVNTDYPAKLPYATPGGLHDVAGGSNGSCSTTLLCTAVSGWDGPTGLGSPNGLAAFTASSTSTAPPAAPTNLGATGGSGSVTLSWTGSGDTTSYNVYRGTASNFEGTAPIATGLTSTSYVDSAVSVGQTYFYTVAAVNSAGQSPMSNEASAAPTAPVTQTMSATVRYTSNSKSLTATVHVTSGGTVVSGASVSITILRNGVSVASGSTTTNSNGDASFKLNRPQHGSTYSTHINSLTKTGYVWDNTQPANTYYYA